MNKYHILLLFSNLPYSVVLAAMFVGLLEMRALAAVVISMASITAVSILSLSGVVVCLGLYNPFEVQKSSMVRFVMDSLMYIPLIGLLVMEFC